MVTSRADIRLRSSLLINIDRTGPVYRIKLLLLQTVMIEVSLIVVIN